jgi:mannose-6-phosphate isomerase-like protein (cupin superfamily)
MTPPATARGYELVDFSQVTASECPCGTARRAFVEAEDFPATVHRTEISLDARLHYHKQHSEVYYFLTCEADARMQLDDEVLPVRPGLCLLIKPGVRHRALGKMTVLIVSLPKFDPADEWFD